MYKNLFLEIQILAGSVNLGNLVRIKLKCLEIIYFKNNLSNVTGIRDSGLHYKYVTAELSQK